MKIVVDASGLLWNKATVLAHPTYFARPRSERSRNAASTFGTGDSFCGVAQQVEPIDLKTIGCVVGSSPAPRSKSPLQCGCIRRASGSSRPLTPTSVSGVGSPSVQAGVIHVSLTLLAFGNPSVILLSSDRIRSSINPLAEIRGAPSVSSVWRGTGQAVSPSGDGILTRTATLIGLQCPGLAYPKPSPLSQRYGCDHWEENQCGAL